MKHFGYIFLTVMLALAGTAAVSAQESDRRDVRRGNREFKDGNFQEAAVDYQKALLRDSTSFAASYNLANTLYRMENYTEAKSLLDTISKAAVISEHASDYYYNSGNTSVSMKDWQGAVDAYKESLLRNPGDLEAKENYIYARKMLETESGPEPEPGSEPGPESGPGPEPGSEPESGRTVSSAAASDKQTVSAADVECDHGQGKGNPGEGQERKGSCIAVQAEREELVILQSQGVEKKKYEYEEIIADIIGYIPGSCDVCPVEGGSA